MFESWILIKIKWQPQSIHNCLLPAVKSLIQYAPNPKTSTFLVSPCSCLCPIHGSHMWVENEDVVGAAPTSDAPTTSEWSRILLPTKVRLMLEVLRYLQNWTSREVTDKICTEDKFPDTIKPSNDMWQFIYCLGNNVYRLKLSVRTHRVSLQKRFDFGPYWFSFGPPATENGWRWLKCIVYDHFPENL